MENITLGFAMCGSFCTFDPVLTALEALKAQYPDIIPILSPASASTDTRFGTAAHFRSRLESICGHDVWDTIAQVEPIGPKKLLDALVIMPCTGNTLAKLAAGIADGRRLLDGGLAAFGGLYLLTRRGRDDLLRFFFSHF